MEAASRLHPEMLGGSTGYCCGPVSFFPLSAINQGWRQRVGTSGERRDCGVCVYVCVCVLNVYTVVLTLESLENLSEILMAGSLPGGIQI